MAFLSEAFEILNKVQTEISEVYGTTQRVTLNPDELFFDIESLLEKGHAASDIVATLVNSTVEQQSCLEDVASDSIQVYQNKLDVPHNTSPVDSDGIAVLKSNHATSDNNSVCSDDYTSDVVFVKECINNISPVDVPVDESNKVIDVESAVVQESGSIMEEAHVICNLLPAFKLSNIIQSLHDHYFNPCRKVVVLELYINLAIDHCWQVSSEAWTQLTEWKSLSKRKNSQTCVLENSCKKEKLINSSEPVASTSWYPVYSTFNDLGAVVEVSACTTCQEIIGDNKYSDVNSDLASGPDVSGDTIKYELPTTSVKGAAVPVVSVNNIVNNYSLNEELHRNEWLSKKLQVIYEMFPNLSHEYLMERVKVSKCDADFERLISELVDEGIPLLPAVEDDNKVNSVVEHSSDNIVTSTNNDELNVDVNIEETIASNVTQLIEIFSDCDPDFIRTKCMEIGADKDAFQHLIVSWTEVKDYPKYEEYVRRQEKLETRKKFLEGMSVKEFLEYFEDPDKVFCNIEKTPSKLYIHNVKIQLQQDFPYAHARDINLVMKEKNYHYLPSFKVLQDEGVFLRRKTKRPRLPQESQLDDIFIKELCYARLESDIKKHLLDEENAKCKMFLEAKRDGKLKECKCCYDDEILEEDMISCSDVSGLHLYCQNCIRRYCEARIGEGFITFQCLQEKCKEEYSLSTLKQILKSSVFSNILKRRQTEEIVSAGLEDLESCPFCSFATIMPNKDDKLFKCLNPECMKDSCRLCKELSHIPLSCDEKKQTEARMFLENEMSEAIVRECWSCKKRYIKEEGCNKMTCSCGAMMCYLCKKRVTSYEHFSDAGAPNKCPLWTNSLTLHAEEVRKRAEEAKEKINPNLSLKNDPTKDIPKIPDYLKKDDSDRRVMANRRLVHVVNPPVELGVRRLMPAIPVDQFFDQLRQQVARPGPWQPVRVGDPHPPFADPPNIIQQHQIIQHPVNVNWREVNPQEPRHYNMGGPRNNVDQYREDDEYLIYQMNQHY